MTRRHFLALSTAAPAAFAATPKGLKWIAHRGGVVDQRYSENSPASLEAAVKAGYWMIESDIRETADGKLITHHDPNFQRFYNDPRRVQDLTLAQIKALRCNPGNTAPPTFAELCEMCRGRLRLMLDTKEPDHSPAFFAEMERELARHNLLKTAYVIGTDQSRQYFTGKALVGVPYTRLQAAVAAKEPAAKLYYLFEWGKTLNEEMIVFANKHRVTVVPSINTFHYGADMAKSLQQGSDDVRRMRSLGITEFQIDSVYEPAFS
jgi:glycerophosphoryl diester phosphodiesterase